jgi:mannose-6-phosphate isomerase
MPFSAVELIDALEASEVSIVHKPWGSEVMIRNDEFILKFIRVRHGHRTSLQRHEVKEELIFIIDGEGTVAGTGELHERPSPALRIRPGTIHRAVGPIHMIEVTTPENDDVVRLEDDYERRS